MNIEFPFADWAAEEGIADEEMESRLKEAADRVATELANGIPEEEMHRVEKQVLLQVIDRNWREHLQQLDALKSVIGMRAYGQRDPLNEYKSEAFTLFDNLLVSLREDVTKAMFRLLLNTQIQRQQMAQQAQQQAQQKSQADALEAAKQGVQRLKDQAAQAQATQAPARSLMEMLGAAAATGEVRSNAQTARDVDLSKDAGAADLSSEALAQLPRNAPCPCGSGKKVKQCHGKVA